MKMTNIDNIKNVEQLSQKKKKKSMLNNIQRCRMNTVLFTCFQSLLIQLFFSSD